MWYCPPKYKSEIPNMNDELMKLEGDLNDKEAKISLAKFLRYNIGFTTELISGIKLAPFQEVTLKAFLNRNFNMFDYINTIWKDVNTASGNTHNFELLTEFERQNVIKVADLTFQSPESLKRYFK